MKLSLTRPAFAVATLLAVSLSQGNAALTAYEGFNYGTHDNTTKFLRDANNHNGGSGWAGEWKEEVGNGIRLDVSETTQTYPAGTDLVGIGGRIENDGSAGTSRRQLSSSLGSTSYFSALINWSTGADFSIKLGNTTHVRWTPLSVNTSGELRTGGDDVSGPNYGLTTGDVQLTAGTDYLVVGRRTSSGSDRTVVVSVFEVGSPGTFLTEPVSWDLSTTFSSGVALSHLDVEAENGNTSVIDEIRFGDSYADVVGVLVPEPGSLVLFGLGGLSLLFRRRR